MVLKAISFALIGVVNTAVDAVVFFLAYRLLLSSSLAAGAGWVISLCHCGTPETAILFAANTFSWFIAVSGSYVMNSFTTFAAESGRKLRIGSYGMFLASGMVGYVGNPTTLVVVGDTLPG